MFCAMRGEVAKLTHAATTAIRRVFAIRCDMWFSIVKKERGFRLPMRIYS